jgi:hypothetical protein
MHLLRLPLLSVGAFLLRGVMWLLTAVHRILQLMVPMPVLGRPGGFAAAWKRQSFEKNIALIGLISIWIGIVCNEWVLTKLLSPDGEMESQNRVAVWLFNMLCIALGLFCVQMGKRIASRDVLLRLSRSYPRTCASFIGLVLMVLLVVCAEGIFYGLNQYHEEQTVAETSWIRMPPPEKDRRADEHPPQRVRGWNIPDSVLGYTLPPNAQIVDKTTRGGTLLYQATYTTDAYHRRITPIDYLEQRHKFLLFFGCSMTFGLGVNDDETMPFYMAQYASHYHPYNYGVSGYGPHYMLAQLQRGTLTKEINENEGIGIYTFIDHHIDRAIGTMRVYNQWEEHAPFYTLDAHDRLVRKGDFTSGRRVVSFLYWVLGKSQILQYFNVTFPTSISEEHIRLTARIIAEAHTVFHQQFPHAEFYVLLYPGVSRGHNLIPYLVEAGVKYLDYSNFIDWPHPELTQVDGAHPTAQGHRVVAAQLAKELGILDEDRER